jgi:hypothetical protein
MSVAVFAWSVVEGMCCLFACRGVVSCLVCYACGGVLHQQPVVACGAHFFVFGVVNFYQFFSI